MKSFLLLLSRIFLASVFIYEAYDSIVRFEETKQTMAAYGITWQPNTLLALTIVGLIVGSIFLIIGYRVSLASTILIAYLLPVTLIVYSFWNDPMPQRQIHLLYFVKNIAIVGGLISIGVHGPGRWSIRRVLDVQRAPLW